MMNYDLKIYKLSIVILGCRMQNICDRVAAASTASAAATPALSTTTTDAEALLLFMQQVVELAGRHRLAFFFFEKEGGGVVYVVVVFEGGRGGGCRASFEVEDGSVVVSCGCGVLIAEFKIAIWVGGAVGGVAFLRALEAVFLIDFIKFKRERVRDPLDLEGGRARRVAGSAGALREDRGDLLLGGDTVPKLGLAREVLCIIIVGISEVRVPI